ncbi:MAG TPA: alpha/beta hydrolase, partial [Kribbella sp.]|uniref:alpha/beta fold hydrolase n=1 Tax=Kribbella sp. TaxID=1871183 RepID=UPI002D891EDD|nr:alpha/beta hydrolase [Kribbella sp.]
VYAGHSMGGMTLMALAERRPDLFGSRIAAAALISTSSGQITSRPFRLPARLDGAATALASARLRRPAVRQLVFGKKVEPAQRPPATCSCRNATET